MDKLVYWFDEIGKEFSDVVGKKCANLGEMTKMGLPVPPGFALSLPMYQKFLKETGIGAEIKGYICGCGDLEGKGIAEIEEISQNLVAMIEKQKMPSSIADEITSYYDQLCKKVKIPDVPVSVRSAGTTSQPGMFETYLNIKGKDEVLEKVKMVWASTFTPRAIAFKCYKGMPIDCDMLGVAIVKMVNAKAAGIGFTIDPVIGDASKVIIEANWGLGEGVVSGVESVDRWVVDKETCEILERTIGNKEKQVIYKEKGAEWDDVPVDKRSAPCLNDDEIKAVVETAILLEDSLGLPQDIEWAIDADLPEGKNTFLLQARPARVAAEKAESPTDRLIDLLAKRYSS